MESLRSMPDDNASPSFSAYRRHRISKDKLVVFQFVWPHVIQTNFVRPQAGRYVVRHRTSPLIDLIRPEVGIVAN